VSSMKSPGSYDASANEDPAAGNHGEFAVSRRHDGR